MYIYIHLYIYMHIYIHTYIHLFFYYNFLHRFLFWKYQNKQTENISNSLTARYILLVIMSSYLSLRNSKHLRSDSFSMITKEPNVDVTTPTRNGSTVAIIYITVSISFSFQIFANCKKH
jgi:hypothetical protein